MSQDAATIAATPSELQSFIQRFNFSLITLSVQPEAEGSFVPKGRFFGGVNRVRAVPGEVFFSNTFQSELGNAQRHGCAIWFMINEGDGKPDEDAPIGKEGEANLNCGKHKNVQVLRTLAIDTDGADIQALYTALDKYGLTSHMVVETSTGRAHCYFLIKPVRAEGANVDQWIAVQKKLASLVSGLDQTMADINQVLRLPTFKNLKRTPPYTIAVRKNAHHEEYDLKALYDLLGAYEFDDFTRKVDGTGYTNGHFKDTYTPFVYPTGPIEPGARRDTICRFIEAIMDNTVPAESKDELFWVHVNPFIKEFIKPSEQADFLPGGSRRKNIEDYLRDQKAYRLRKKAAKVSQQAVHEFDHIQAIEDNKLEDQFYLNFPGDLGMITRELHSHSPYMSMEMCFAGAAIISGALKAETFRYENSWPMINGLVIAGTGAGKTTLQKAVEISLKEAGICGRYSQLVEFQKSVPALHTQMYAAGGVATCMVDEAGDYLQGITAKNAPNYAAALKKYFKEGTTGSGRGAKLSPGGSLAYTLPAIHGGMLSLWMFIQPDKFAASLDLSDMSDGFLPRFFVFRGYSHLDLLGSEERGDFHPSMDMQVWMQSLSNLLAHGTDAQLTAVTEQAATDCRVQYPKATLKDVRQFQLEAVFRARFEARNLSEKVNIQLTSEAKAARDAYFMERQALADQVRRERGENDASEGIFFRIREMLNRLVCNAASIGSSYARGEPVMVSEDLMLACIRFHRFQTDRFLRNELADMREDRDLSNVVKAVHAACKKKGSPANTREVTLALKGTHRPRNLAALLKCAAESGLIWSEERPHPRVKNKPVRVFMPALSEEGPIT